MAEPRKPILLNAFNMNCVGHINHGLWTHPRDRSTDYRLLPYWTNLARTLEREVADELQAWVDEAGVDGFNLSRTVVPESYEDFVELIVPELQNRGLYKTAYAPGTLRHKLFGAQDTLPERHAGARFRVGAPAEAPAA